MLSGKAMGHESLLPVCRHAFAGCALAPVCRLALGRRLALLQHEGGRLPNVPAAKAQRSACLHTAVWQHSSL